MKFGKYIRGCLHDLKGELAKEKRLKKYKQYNLPSTGDEMYKYAAWINAYTDVKVESILELGANFGQDAEVLSDIYHVPKENVWCFEAHPQIFEAAKKMHGFRCYNYAVYNQQMTMEFNCCDINAHNTGTSSLLKSLKFENGKLCKVEAVRMDDFMNKNHISGFDFCKIDVEGCNYEALEGFGERLRDVKVIQVEAEHVECYGGGQKLYDDIKRLLESMGFECMMFERHLEQSDSLWCKKEWIKIHV